jgi:hypothetical protein
MVRAHAPRRVLGLRQPRAPHDLAGRAPTPRTARARHLARCCLMVAIVEPDEEELYLLAILLDDTGIDIAEFMFLNEENEHGRFRCWDYQFAWWSRPVPQQIDQSGRALGKSWGIQMRACAFPFSYPDQDMLLTAPELNHLRPLVDAVESRLLTSRIMTEMLPDTKGKGIARQPHWQVRFRNGAKIVSRLPWPRREGRQGPARHQAGDRRGPGLPAGRLDRDRRVPQPRQRRRPVAGPRRVRACATSSTSTASPRLVGAPQDGHAPAVVDRARGARRQDHHLRRLPAEPRLQAQHLRRARRRHQPAVRARPADGLRRPGERQRVQPGRLLRGQDHLRGAAGPAPDHAAGRQALRDAQGRLVQGPEGLQRLLRRHGRRRHHRPLRDPRVRPARRRAARAARLPGPHPHAADLPRRPGGDRRGGPALLRRQDVTFSIDRTGLGFDLYQRLHRQHGQADQGLQLLRQVRRRPGGPRAGGQGGDRGPGDRAQHRRVRLRRAARGRRRQGLPAALRPRAAHRVAGPVLRHRQVVREGARTAPSASTPRAPSTPWTPAR